MANNAWKILGLGPDPGLVLTVDFSNTGRPLAGFRDLMPRLDPPVTAWETLPPTAGQVGTTDYVDWWLAEIRHSGRSVRAVLGYCAGAVFAAEMAEHIAIWQDAPLLVLLDPELPNTPGLCRDFHIAGDAMAAILSPEELREFHNAGLQVQATFGDNLTVVGAALGEIFTAAIATAAKRLDLDDEIRDELAGVFGSLVGYLEAATHFDPRPIWSKSIVIHSAGLGGAARAGHGIMIDVNHRDLLRHDATARALSDVLAGRTVRRTT